MAREIEFVTGPDPEPDEPSDSFHRPASGRSRLLILLGVLAVAAVAVWVASRPTSGDERAARPVRTVTATPSGATPTTTTPTTARPTQRVCTAAGRINPQLRRLAARNFPGLEVLPAQSYRCTIGTGAQRQVVSESIAARVRAVVIEVQATRRVGDSGQYLPVPAGTGLVLLSSFESQSAGLNVIAEAYGRPRASFDGTALGMLASDVSLGLVL